MLIQDFINEFERRTDVAYKRGREYGRISVTSIKSPNAWYERHVTHLDGQMVCAYYINPTEGTISELTWAADSLGVPDLSFKGINKFPGRWEGANA